MPFVGDDTLGSESGFFEWVDTSRVHVFLFCWFSLSALRGREGFLCEILDWFEPRRLAPENFQNHLIAFLVPFRTPSAVPSLPRFQEVPNSPVNFQKSLIRRDYVLRVLAESEWEAVKLKS